MCFESFCDVKGETSFVRILESLHTYTHVLKGGESMVFLSFSPRQDLRRLQVGNEWNKKKRLPPLSFFLMKKKKSKAALSSFVSLWSLTRNTFRPFTVACMMENLNRDSIRLN